LPLAALGVRVKPDREVILRIEDEQARALNALAMAEEATVSEIIRDAIADLIEKRRGDKDFQERLKRAVERNREALDLLAK
jgi:predicted transcriptional regulator